MSWWNKYVGIPYKDYGRDESGADCWGLARLALWRERQAALPPFADEVAYCALSPREKLRYIQQTADKECKFHKIIKPEDHQPFDVLLFRWGSLTAHIGIVTVPGYMLHTQQGIDACVVSYRTGEYACRLMGAYRHGAL